MRKIPTLFERGPGRTVIDRLHPDCAWVLAGEGVATEKLDGTNVRLTIRSGEIVRVEKRRNPGKDQKARGIRDPWYVDADADAPGDRWITAAAEATDTRTWPDGEHSCEALGPKIQGNPLGLAAHVCLPFDLHAPVIAIDDRGYEALRALLGTLDSAYSPGHVAEGLVFHHPDGRRAKIKRKDFPRA